MLAEPILTRLFQSYWRLSRSVTLGAQGMVLDADNRILLVRHGYRPGWHMPGGGIEKGEDIVTGLTRELDEEAGIRIEGEPLLFSLYTNFKAFPGDHIALFVVRRWSQPHIPPSSYEVREQRFFARNELPGDAVPPVARRLAEVLDGKPRSAAW